MSDAEKKQEYEAIPEKGVSGHVKYVNEIDYNGKPVNVLRFWEEKVVKGQIVRTEFQWLTSIKITEKNAEKIANAGRKRWKIENEDLTVKRTGRKGSDACQE